MAIPLEEGNNDIVMTYHPFGVTAGIIASVLGLLLVLGYALVTEKLKKQKYTPTVATTEE